MEKYVGSGCVSNLAEILELHFSATTGGNFSVKVEQNITVETLKKIVSKKLKVSKDRIALIFLEKELIEGTLTENGIVNNSKIILTPNVETGLSAQRAENTVMQALESLNDIQVNDFLSGKSPLNLSVRLGDHMMLIQLQLSTLSPSQQNTLKQKVASASALKNAHRNSAKARVDVPPDTAPSSKRMKPNEITHVCPEDLSRQSTSVQSSDNEHTPSPIKSLSNLVSSPEGNLKRNKIYDAALYTPSENFTDPIAAKLTSCLCTRLTSKGLYPNSNCSNNNNCDSTPVSSASVMDQVQKLSSATPREVDQRDWSQVKSVNKSRQLRIETIRKSSRASPVPTTSSSTVNSVQPTLNTSTDNPALAEASRNLTQTLRKLSKRVFTNRINLSEKSSSAQSSSSAGSSASQALSTSDSAGTSSGAVIESMKHHGKGIYSGTFSGTLSPSLQDKFGRPKRDISTIIHILNDLLSATPQCAKNGAKIIFEPTSGPSTLSSSSSTTSLFKVRRIKTSTSSIDSHKICTYGQCKGHAKSDSNELCRIKSAQSDCSECSHNSHTKKIELENTKTKTKLDHLRMVMQQKKINREARKLQASPYNVKAGGVLLSSLPLMNTSDNSKGDEILDSSVDSSNTAESSSTTSTFGIENHLVEEASIA